MRDAQLLCMDVLAGLGQLEDDSVQCVVTSPPYWGLRDYGEEEQIGLEPTPEEYVAKMVEVFREVRRVLKSDGTVWLNLGDAYATQGHSARDRDVKGKHLVGGGLRSWGEDRQNVMKTAGISGLKPKDLVGIPWRVAFALQADGWWLRSDIIWSKPNPMPESVTDRPTKSHEYVFLLTKSARYYYDAEAIAETSIHAGTTVFNDQGENAQMGRYGQTREGFLKAEGVTVADVRNSRSVWTFTTKPYPDAHFATFPPALPERCIKAGTKEGDRVLDPFCGAGTTGVVALRLNRNFVGIELNGEYAEMARDRLQTDAPLLNKVSL